MIVSEYLRYIAVLLLIIFVVYTVSFKRKASKKPKFGLNFIANLLVYLLEITIMFIVTRMILGLFDTSLSGNGDSIPKQFLDFFTAYQILLFVVLKLYDSLQKDAYSSLIYKIDLAQYALDGNKTLPDVVFENEEFSRNSDSLPGSN